MSAKWAWLILKAGLNGWDSLTPFEDSNLSLSLFFSKKHPPSCLIQVCWITELTMAGGAVPYIGWTRGQVPQGIEQ